MTKKKLKYQYKPPSTLDINLEDYGTFEDGPLPDHDEHDEPRCWKQPPDPTFVYEGTVTADGRFVTFDEAAQDEIRSVNDRRPIPVCVGEKVGRASPGRVRFKVVQISTGPAADILVD